MAGPAARSYMGGSVIEQPKAIIGTDDSRLPPRMPLPDIAIESALPASLAPQRPTAVFLEGRAPGVRALELLVDGTAHRPSAQRMPRADLGERCGWGGGGPPPRPRRGGNDGPRRGGRGRGDQPRPHRGERRGTAPFLARRGTPVALCAK